MTNICAFFLVDQIETCFCEPEEKELVNDSGWSILRYAYVQDVIPLTSNILVNLFWNQKLTQVNKIGIMRLKSNRVGVK